MAEKAAEILKRVGSFSENGIRLAIENVIPDENEQKVFTETLENVSSHLRSPTAKKRKIQRKILPSAKTVFEQQILPQIRNKLTDYERKQFVLEDVEWTASLNFRTDFKDMTTEELKETHSKIIAEEEIIRNLDLLVKFHRGILYLTAYKSVSEQDNYKEWFYEEFKVTYSTALRYMIVSVLLRRYPRLIICGLSFSQILKHNKRILKFFETDEEGLGDRLGLAVNLSTQKKATNILPSDASICIPTYQFAVDPDSLAFADNPACVEISENADDEWQKWLKQSCSTGEIHEIISPYDDTDDIAEEVLKVCFKS